MNSTRSCSMNISEIIPTFATPTKRNEHIRILTTPDLSIRDVDQAVKDQICSLHFVF